MQYSQLVSFAPNNKQASKRGVRIPLIYNFQIRCPFRLGYSTGRALTCDNICHIRCQTSLRSGSDKGRPECSRQAITALPAKKPQLPGSSRSHPTTLSRLSRITPTSNESRLSKSKLLDCGPIESAGSKLAPPEGRLNRHQPDGQFPGYRPLSAELGKIFPS